MLKYFGITYCVYKNTVTFICPKWLTHWPDILHLREVNIYPSTNVLSANLKYNIITRTKLCRRTEKCAFMTCEPDSGSRHLKQAPLSVVSVEGLRCLDYCGRLQADVCQAFLSNLPNCQVLQSKTSSRHPLSSRGKKV